MVVFQTFPFVVVALFAAFAVLSNCFQDNLLQRIGLSGICAGAVLTVFVMLRGHPETTGTYLLLGYGLTFYSIGTALKFRHYYRKVLKNVTSSCSVVRHPY